LLLVLSALSWRPWLFLLALSARWSAAWVPWTEEASPFPGSGELAAVEAGGWLPGGLVFSTATRSRSGRGDRPAGLGILHQQGQANPEDGPKQRPMTTRSWPRRRWRLGRPARPGRVSSSRRWTRCCRTSRPQTTSARSRSQPTTSARITFQGLATTAPTRSSPSPADRALPGRGRGEATLVEVGDGTGSVTIRLRR
jgi:hypothetical protein